MKTEARHCTDAWMYMRRPHGMKDSHPYLGRPRGYVRPRGRTTPQVTAGLNREESAEAIVPEDARRWGSWGRAERASEPWNEGSERMQGTQKTLDSYPGRNTTESEEYRGAQSMCVMESADRVTYDDLIEKVLR